MGNRILFSYVNKILCMGRTLYGNKIIPYGSNILFMGIITSLENIN